MPVSAPVLTMLEPLWLIAGVAGAAVAVLSHLLVRRRPRALVFPGTRLLTATTAAAARRSRPRDLALLALRMAIPLLLALAFARPQALRAGGADAPGERLILILDASASMRRAAPEGGELFDVARRRAIEALEALDPQRDAAGVVLAARTPSALLPSLTGAIPALSAALEAATPTLEPLDASGAVALAQRLAGEPGARLVVLSDFQGDQWMGLSATFEPVAISPAPGANRAGVTDLTISPALPRRGEPVRVTARIVSDSPEPIDLPVMLVTDVESVVARVRVSAPSPASATFTTTFRASGPQRLTVSVPADGFPHDDARRAVVEVADAARAALITSGAEGFGRAGAWFSAALAARSASGDAPILVAPGEAVDLAAFDDLVIADAGALSDRALDAIGDRLRAGFGALWILDNAASGASLARLAARAGIDVPPPATTGPMSLTPAPDERLPLPALASLRLRVEVAPVEWPHAREPATYTDGSPFLTEATLFGSRVLILRASFDPARSDTVRSPLFPALIDALLASLRPQELRPSALTAGATHGPPDFLSRGDRVLAVNLDASESEPGGAIPEPRASGDESGAWTLGAERTPQELWPLALGAALVLMAVESLLAAGARRRPEARP